MSKKIDIYSYIPANSANHFDAYMDPEVRATIRKDPHKYAVEQSLTAPNVPTADVEVKVVTCKADITYIPLWDANLSYEVQNLQNIQAAGVGGPTPVSTIGSVSSVFCICVTVSTLGCATSFSSVDVL